MNFLITILVVLLIVLVLFILGVYLYAIYKLNKFKNKIKNKMYQNIKDIAIEETPNIIKGVRGKFNKNK